MLANQNQRNVMARGFAGTHNGSMPAYGAVGEMETYLNGMRHTSMRALAGKHDGPKPNFSPQSKGEVMDSQEISTKHGWSVVYVVKNNAGYYVVEHYCPRSNSHLVDGKYPTMDEAKESANRIAFQLRNTGKVEGISGLNGYSQLGQGAIAPTTLLLASAVVTYIGFDAPGARPVLKQIAKTFNEPRSFIQNSMAFIGLAGVTYSLLKQTGEI
tara:strand:- start:88 stop:726 length:639 start_codon:yes stop_codon:yes gene_type:complete